MPEPPAPSGLKVTAYLIYDDVSDSSFELLNDKPKALWNTIIGEGDPEKPSTSTWIRLTGPLDGLRVKIFNGMKKAEDQETSEF